MTQHRWILEKPAAAGRLQKWRCRKCKATVTHSGTLPTEQQHGSRIVYEAGGTRQTLLQGDRIPVCPVVMFLPRPKRGIVQALRGAE